MFLKIFINISKICGISFINKEIFQKRKRKMNNKKKKKKKREDFAKTKKREKKEKISNIFKN